MILRGFESASNGMLSLIDMNDNTANNLANVNTAGYKRSALTFKNVMNTSVYQENGELINGGTRYLGDLSMGSETMRLTYDFTQGALQKTAVPYDLAIQGDGFFKLRDGSGNVSYTRNGSFCENSQGFLTTKDGESVLDNQNNPIRLFNDDTQGMKSKQLNISEEGNIEAFDGKTRVVLGSIAIKDFSNKEDLKLVGASKYAPTSTNNREVTATKYTLQQGSLEMSNSNVIKEMLNTINTSRNYESLGKVITSNSELLDSAISVGRIKG